MTGKNGHTCRRYSTICRKVNEKIVINGANNNKGRSVIHPPQNSLNLRFFRILFVIIMTYRQEIAPTKPLLNEDFEIVSELRVDFLKFGYKGLLL